MTASAQPARGNTGPQVFFFKHPLERSRYKAGIPGRFSFAVTGSALSRTGARFRLRTDWCGNVYADAYANETPGPNVDPHVFSDVIPWHLSFCRICDKKSKNLVDGARLNERTRAGDIIVFGSPVPAHAIWVDAVICVASVPQLDGPLSLASNSGSFRDQLPALQAYDWESFRATRSYQLNLADAEEGGSHHQAAFVPYPIIVGRRWPNPASTTPEELLRHFLEGRGFNFIPLGEKQASSGKAVAGRPGLFCKHFEDAGRLLAQAVTLVDWDHGKRLLKILFDEADTLVLDPTEPVQRLRRHTAEEVPVEAAQ